jgi:hypothetical protein
MVHLDTPPPTHSHTFTDPAQNNDRTQVSNHTDHNNRAVIAAGQRPQQPRNSLTPQHHQDQPDQQRQRQLRASRELLSDCRHDCLAILCFTAAIAGVFGGTYLLAQGTATTERSPCTVLGLAQCLYEQPRGKPPYSRGYLPHVKVQFGAQELCDFNAGNDRERGEESSEADCLAWVAAHPNGAQWVPILVTKRALPNPTSACGSSSTCCDCMHAVYAGTVLECERMDGRCADSWSLQRGGVMVAGIFALAFSVGLLCVVACALYYDCRRRFPRSCLCWSQEGGDSGRACLHAACCSQQYPPIPNP